MSTAVCGSEEHHLSVESVDWGAEVTRGTCVS